MICSPAPLYLPRKPSSHETSLSRYSQHRGSDCRRLPAPGIAPICAISPGELRDAKLFLWQHREWHACAGLFFIDVEFSEWFGGIIAVSRRAKFQSSRNAYRAFVFAEMPEWPERDSGIHQCLGDGNHHRTVRCRRLPRCAVPCCGDIDADERSI